jgi:uncharacterized lipoprotein YbaY
VRGPAAAAGLDYFTVKTLRATVQNGRIILDDDVALPDGTVLDVVVADGDTLDAPERDRLHQALQRAFEMAEQGDTIPIDALMTELRSR